jgi:hypothetical protein
MSDAAMPRSVKLGDSCLREIPNLLTKEEIRDLDYCSRAIVLKK